jgi:AcrR family transcriptional regulator
MAGEAATPTPPQQRTARVRGARLRGQILRRAGELASIDGLEQVSLGRLAAEMGMSKSGLYAYFTSKQDLQLATVDCGWRVFEAHVIAPGGDGVEALLERWISYYEREVFPGGCLFVTAGMEFANRDGPVHDALAAAIERQIRALEAALADEHVNGADPAQLAFELHALLTAANHRFRISRDRAAFAQGRAAVRRLLATATATTTAD